MNNTAAGPQASSTVYNRPAPAPVQRVLMISIDGMHSGDLERYIVEEPDSVLAQLAGGGVRYTNAMAPFPSDSFPSVLAWATGGTPRSTGVFYDISFDRALSPPGSDCSTRGAHVDYSESPDVDMNKLDGGGGLDPNRLPRDPTHACVPVYPHEYLRVNTIFEVIKAANLRTAWSDKHVTYEVLDGPSGTGVDDLFNPEVAAISTKVLATVQAYDQSKVNAVLNQIQGRDHAGNAAAVPAFFGMNFQAVSTTQKLEKYADASGAPSTQLKAALDGVDQQLGTLVSALNEQRALATTALIVMASHGQSPIDPSRVKRLPTTLIPDLVNEVGTGLLAAATQDAVALLWLTDPTKTETVAQHLRDKADSAGIEHLITGESLAASFGDPSTDSRVPDIIVVAQTGVIYTDSSKKFAEHGGFSDDDRKVALMVIGGIETSKVVELPVETRQLAPTILDALGLNPTMLRALAVEPTERLPGLSFAH